MVKVTRSRGVNDHQRTRVPVVEELGNHKEGVVRVVVVAVALVLGLRRTVTAGIVTWVSRHIRAKIRSEVDSELGC